jgi:cell division protein FtsA
MGISGGIVQEITDPKFSTGVGLVLYGLRPEMISGTPFRTEVGGGQHATLSGDGLVKSIASRMKTWFDEL